MEEPLLVYLHNCPSLRCPRDGQLVLISVEVDQGAYERPKLYCFHSGNELEYIKIMEKKGV